MYTGPHVLIPNNERIELLLHQWEFHFTLFITVTSIKFHLIFFKYKILYWNYIISALFWQHEDTFVTSLHLLHQI